MPIIYSAYDNAENNTKIIPFMFNDMPFVPLYNNKIPIDVKNIEPITVFVSFSLKNIDIINATITG